MPNAALHLLLASSVFGRWAVGEPEAAARGPAVRNAFLHGAVGPDMGYFPGGHPALSELAHRATPVSLARALAAEARTAAERAYAWGWATHVLADVALHPLVNEAVGELLHGQRGRRVAPADDPVSHLRVEVGLDAVFLGRNPALRGVRLVPALTPGGLGFLTRAYRRTYGASPPKHAFLASHRGVCHAAGPLLTLNRLASVALGGASNPTLRTLSGVPLRLLSALSPRDSHAAGLFSPLAPPAWLVERVDRWVAAFPRLFAAHHRSGLDALGEHDLDTGEAILQPRQAGEVEQTLAGPGSRGPLAGLALSA